MDISSLHGLDIHQAALFELRIQLMHGFNLSRHYFMLELGLWRVLVWRDMGGHHTRFHYISMMMVAVLLFFLLILSHNMVVLSESTSTLCCDFREDTRIIAVIVGVEVCSSNDLVSRSTWLLFQGH